MPELQPEAIALAESDAGLVTAPAGCGKTQLVTEAVHHAATLGQRRQLVLTHTHAGVDVLRARLVRAGVDRGAYQVETIAGWAQRFAISFPQRCAIDVPPRHKDYYDKAYASVTELLDIPAIQQVIASSYGGAFIDEYQDCTRSQHDLVIALGRTIPIRVLGDPLQGIFDFAGAIDWDEHVGDTFTEVGPLSTPWRWAGKNDTLGQWLIDQRGTFETAAGINLQGAPISVRTPNPTVNIAQEFVVACNAMLRREGSVVVISKWARTYHSIAQKLKGAYSVIEPIEAPDLAKHARALGTTTGTDLVLATVEFASTCASGVGPSIGSALAKFKNGETPNPSNYREKRAYVERLVAVADGGGAPAIHRALAEIKNSPDTRVYRRELMDDFMRALSVCDGVPDETTIMEAVDDVRNRTRHAGRRLPLRGFGTPLLVKGLEFDHVLVLKPEEMSRRELYVALSRATRTATVLSSDSTITFNA